MTSKRIAVVTTVALLMVVSGGAGVLGATGGTVADDARSLADGDAVAAQEQNETTTVSETETTAVGEETTTALADPNTVAITFENQTSNGTVVNVSQAVLPDGGFITVHLAENVSGNFTTTVTADMVGQRVGNSTFLETGLNENVTIRLDQPLAESQMLIAVVHRDTNGNQQYDPALEQVETTTADVTETTTPAGTAEATTTPAGEQVDAPYTQTPGDQPIMATAFIRVEDGAGAVETTTVANETTTEAA